MIQKRIERNQEQKRKIGHGSKKWQTLTLAKEHRRRGLPRLSSPAHQGHPRRRYAGARDGPAPPLVGERHRAGLRARGYSGKGSTANPLDDGVLPHGRARTPAKWVTAAPVLPFSAQRATAVRVEREGGGRSAARVQGGAGVARICSREACGGPSDSDPTVRGDAAANGLKMTQEGRCVGLFWRPGRRLPG